MTFAPAYRFRCLSAPTAFGEDTLEKRRTLHGAMQLDEEEQC
jgi:hypothetical protein